MGVPNNSRLFPDGYNVYFTCLHMSPLISRKLKTGNIYYDIDSRRPGSSLDESSLHKNPYFDSLYAQVASEVRILFTLYYSKMTPSSQMMLQNLFYVIFGLGGKRILTNIYISKNCLHQVAPFITCIDLPKVTGHSKLR